MNCLKHIVIVIVLFALIGTAKAATDHTRLVPGSGFAGSTPEPNSVGNPGDYGYDANAIARWDVVPYQDFTGVLNTGIVAFHMAGINRVEFSAQGGPWASVSEMTFNPQTGIKEYWVELDAADFNDGLVEVRAIAYPNVGKPRLLESLYLYANAGGSLPMDVIYVGLDGNDSNPGTRASPMRTISYAIDKINWTNCVTEGNWKTCDGAGKIILLAEGTYELSYGSRDAFHIDNKRYITVEPDIGLDRNDVIIGWPTRQTSRPFVSKMHWKGVSFDFSTIQDYYNDGYIWLDNCRWYFSDGWTASYPDELLYPFAAHGRYVYATDCFAEDICYGMCGFKLARNCSVYKISGDAYANTEVVLNSQASKIGAGTGFHNDIWQIFQHGYNFIVYGLEVKGDIVDTQAVFLDHYESSHTDYAVIDVNFDFSYTNGGPPFTQFNSASTNLYFRNVRWPNQQIIFRTDYAPPGTFIAHNVVFDNCQLYPANYTAYVMNNNKPEGVTFKNCYYNEVPRECVDNGKLMNYILQWKQGSITMPTLMQKIGAWKAGTGC